MKEEIFLSCMPQRTRTKTRELYGIKTKTKTKIRKNGKLKKLNKMENPHTHTHVSLLLIFLLHVARLVIFLFLVFWPWLLQQQPHECVVKILLHSTGVCLNLVEPSRACAIMQHNVYPFQNKTFLKCFSMFPSCKL